MDTMNRALPNPQMFNSQANPQTSAGSAGGKVIPAQPKQPMRNTPAYGQFTDTLSPKDAPMRKGLTDQQVMWLKQNLLGRQGGGNEGMQFQRQLGKYIEGAGGMQPFMQMLGQMPGWQKRQVVPGGTQKMTANNFRPGVPREGKEHSVGQVGGIVSPVAPPKIQPQPQPPSPPHPPPILYAQPQPQQQALRQPQQAPMQSQQPQQGVQPQAQPQRQQPGQQQLQARQPQQQQAAQPAHRATQAHYGGEQDRERQKAKDREFFGKRGVALTPELEEGMRNLTDQYLSALIDLGYTEADAAAQLAQQKERLATDYGSNMADLEEVQAGTGMLDSGQHRTARTELNTSAGRGFQDLATNAASQQRAIANAKAALLEALRSGRMDLNLDATMDSVLNSVQGGHAGLPKGGGKRRRNSGKRRRKA